MAEDKLTAIQGAKILLVEDNKINQLVIKRLLTYLGMQVTVAENGADAVRHVSEYPHQIFDLVLMDIQMPIMDGREATRKIRELAGPVCEIPIIAISGDDIAEENGANLAAGMNAQITKPIEFHEVFELFPQFLKKQSTVNSSLDLTQIIPPSVKIDIPGIDTSAGLTRVAGNKDLYEELLAAFVASNRNFVEEIDQNFQNEAFSQNEFLAHAIKGTSGSLGAMGLHKAAHLLEESCRRKQFDQKVVALFDQELKQTVAAIEAYLMRCSTQELELGVQKSDNREHLADKLELLKNQLQDFDADALTTLNDIHSRLDIPKPSQFHSVEIAINNLDFDLALIKLNQYTQLIFNS